MMPDEPQIQPPDWENPPCPACFAFDAPAGLPQTPEEFAAHMRLAYASGMTSGFLMCRMKADTWQFLCRTHVEAAQGVIDAVCADHGYPRDKVYADIGISMPETQKH
jgi:hypothetical protein